MDATTLAKQLSDLAADGVAGIAESDRLALLVASTKLRDVVENPVEKTVRLMWSTQDASMLRLAVDMGLIDTAVAKGSSVTVQELGTQSNADATLVRRIMRVLANLSVFTELTPDTFTATPLAHAYASPSPLREAVIALHSTNSTVAQLPDYFAANGYKNPTDTAKGPWQFAQRSEENHWDWLMRHPRDHKAFNVMMRLQNVVRGQCWYEYYPVLEKLKVDDSERVVLADVGGGLGHDLVDFHARYPDLPGKLLLEDQQQVLDDAKDLPLKIVKVAHDFFTPQPEIVQGAKAYYLRTVLHDWADVQAHQILVGLRNAMAPDSLLLLSEAVLPEQGVKVFETIMDIRMMAYFASLERTEKQWRELIEGAGLEILKFWEPNAGGEAPDLNHRLIEARVRQ